MATQKDEKAKADHIRIVKLLTRIVAGPVAGVRWAARGIKRLFGARGSAAQKHAAEKQRQSGIRRELRGLSAKHDGGRPVA
jgi:hypothetical protein